MIRLRSRERCVQLLDEGGRELAVGSYEIHDQFEALALRDECLACLFVGPSLGSFDHLAREALRYEGQRQAPIDVVEPLDDPGFDSEATQAALTNGHAIRFAHPGQELAPRSTERLEARERPVSR